MSLSVVLGLYLISVPAHNMFTNLFVENSVEIAFQFTHIASFFRFYPKDDYRSIQILTPGPAQKSMIFDVFFEKHKQ